MIVPLAMRDANRRINFNRSDRKRELLLSLMIDLSRLSGCALRKRIALCSCATRFGTNCSEENQNRRRRRRCWRRRWRAKQKKKKARPSRFSMLQRATYVADELLPRSSGKKRSKPQKVIIQLRQLRRFYGLVWLIAFASEQLPSYWCWVVGIVVVIVVIVVPKTMSEYAT